MLFEFFLNYLKNFKKAILVFRDPKKEKILDELDTLGVAIKPISFYEYGYSFPAEQTQLLTSSKAFLDGNIFIQNPSSWLPVLLMELSSEQKIIDMCSAPGGKAMHVATLFGELPTMVESKQHRFNRLIQSLNESGFSINKDDSKLVNADGKHLPAEHEGEVLLFLHSRLRHRLTKRHAFVSFDQCVHGQLLLELGELGFIEVLRGHSRSMNRC